MSRSVTVELFGLPGSGKSSLANEVAGRLRTDGVAVWVPSAAIDPSVAGPVRIARKLVLATGECLRAPDRARNAIAGVATGVRSSGGGTLARSLQWLATQRLLSAARGRPGVHLFEEGPLQALWSVGLRGRVDPLLARVDLRSVAADLVVVVDVPVSVVAERLAARTSRHSRIQQGTAEGRRVELDRGAELVERLLAWRAAREVPGEILRVPNSSEADHGLAIAVIMERIARILGT